MVFKYYDDSISLTKESYSSVVSHRVSGLSGGESVQLIGFCSQYYFVSLATRA